MSSVNRNGSNSKKIKPSLDKIEASNEASSSEEKLILERNLARMEVLLSNSAKGIHVLFDNRAISNVLKVVQDDKDFYNFDKMKKVQDVMTALISKKTYLDKISFLHSLDEESYSMVLRAYFHIVENTVRASNDISH